MYSLILPNKRLLGFPVTINFMPFVNFLIFFQNHAGILDHWIAVQILNFRKFMPSFRLQFYFVFLAEIRKSSGKQVFNSSYFQLFLGSHFMLKDFLSLLCSSSLKIELTFWRMGNPVSGVTHTKQNLENVEVGRDHNEAREVNIIELLGWTLALTQKSCIAVNILGKCKSGVRFVDLRQKGCFLQNELLSNNGHEPQNTDCN